MPDANTIDKNMIVVALIIAIGIVIAAFIVVSVDPPETNSNTGRTITLSVDAFRDSMTITPNQDYTAIQSSCSMADSGDTIHVQGEVIEVGCIDTDMDVGFVYSYLTLKEISSTGSDFFFVGNLTDEFSAGDIVEITMRVIDCKSTYDTFWGGKVYLSGEFLAEDFYHGKYITQPMMPQDRVKTI